MCFSTAILQTSPLRHPTATIQQIIMDIFRSLKVLNITGPFEQEQERIVGSATILQVGLNTIRCTRYGFASIRGAVAIASFYKIRDLLVSNDVGSRVEIDLRQMQHAQPSKAVSVLAHWRDIGSISRYQEACSVGILIRPRLAQRSLRSLFQLMRCQA